MLNVLRRKNKNNKSQYIPMQTEWMVALNTAINKVLAGQRGPARQDSGDRVHPPIIRLASHTFTRHALYKGATYRGLWLNGKPHGS